MKLWMIALTGLAIFVGASSFITHTRAQEVAKGLPSPVVVELFTSQSCSSCPPADRVLEQLSGIKNVIALGCHVTYWDHLHWKDTFSRDFCTARQKNYVVTMNARGPYTPQAIINGRYEMIGSKSAQVNGTILDAAREGQIKPARMFRDGQNIKIELPDLNRPDREYTLWLIGFENGESVSMKSGENTGRTVNYTNPIVKMDILGKWDGSGRLITKAASELSTASGWAVIAQEKTMGPIVAAGQIRL